MGEVFEDVNFEQSSSYFTDVPDTRSSMAILTFALNSCFARSGSLEVMILVDVDVFLNRVRVADE